MTFRQLLIFVLFNFLILSCKEDVKSIKPTKGPITESVYASGFIKSKNQYKVISAVSGIVSDIFVNEGDIVKKGQPLFKIKNSTIGLNIEQAKISKELNEYSSNLLKVLDLENSIENARLKMLNDSVFLNRQKRLWDQDVGSKVELENRLLAYENSKNLFESAKIKLEDLKRQLEIAERQANNNLRISETLASDFVIRSMIDGRVFSVLTEKGEFASAQTALAIIGDARHFLIELLVDEYDIAKLNTGQKVFLRMDSYKNEVFEAEINRIIPIMNEKSKSFKVEAFFTKSPSVLFPNMTVEANILIRTKENVLILPRNYLSENDEVFLKNGNKVKVKTGLKDYQKVEILNGITDEDEIIEPTL